MFSLVLWPILLCGSNDSSGAFILHALIVLWCGAAAYLLLSQGVFRGVAFRPIIWGTSGKCVSRGHPGMSIEGWDICFPPCLVMEFLIMGSMGC